MQDTDFGQKTCSSFRVPELIQFINSVKNISIHPGIVYTVRTKCNKGYYFRNLASITVPERHCSGQVGFTSEPSKGDKGYRKKKKESLEREDQKRVGNGTRMQF